MSLPTYEEKIMMLLRDLKQNRYTDDLHSFLAHIKGGVVFVEYGSGNYCFDERYDDGTEMSFRGYLSESMARLKCLAIELETVEM